MTDFSPLSVAIHACVCAHSDAQAARMNAADLTMRARRREAQGFPGIAAVLRDLAVGEEARAVVLEAHAAELRKRVEAMVGEESAA